MSSSSIGRPAPLPNALSDIRDLEPFAQVELVVLDLDGTLLTDINDLPATAEWRTRSHLVNRLKSRGVPLTLATGRAFAGARAAIEAVSRHKDTPVILYNGSVVLTAAGVLLAQRALSATAVEGLTSAVTRVGGSALLYWLNADLSGRLQGEWAVFVGDGKSPEREFNGLTVSSPEFVPAEAGCVAALLWAEDASVRSRLVDAVEHVQGISPTVSGSRYIEVRPIGSSKAVGLEALLGHLRIPPHRVMAIGDNDNDVELLQAVGLSVCVGNASDRAQSSSRFKTTYSSSSGVIEALQLVTRARRLWTGKITRHEHE
jgi:Cof subfamily protein (haloacid dehalogenase superfamily)